MITDNAQPVRFTRMPVLKLCCLLLLFEIMSPELRAQTDFHDYNTKYVGEIGVEAGTAEYYGDLHANSSFHSPKPTLGIFYRYFFTNYLGASIHLHFAQLGYTDAYNTDTFQHTRNLSFDTNVWDVSVQGDFNFFRFEPGSLSYRFTPYFTLGVGIFHFNPYTYYQTQKYYLQPLGTEGQNSLLYPHRKKYSLWSFDIPLGVGIKYNLNRSWNVALGFTYRYTGTDYLDDVSTTYAGINAFPPEKNGKPSMAATLQDRSGFYGTPLGEAGRQRGDSRNKDQFLSIEFSISYLFDRYRCPVF